MALVNSSMSVKNKGFEPVVSLNETTLQKSNQAVPVAQDSNGIKPKGI